MRSSCPVILFLPARPPISRRVTIDCRAVAAGLAGIEPLCEIPERLDARDRMIELSIPFTIGLSTGSRLQPDEQEYSDML